MSDSLILPDPNDPGAYADYMAPDRLQSNMRNGPASYEHLGLLVDYIKDAYAGTAETLAQLLDHGEITYDLLGVLFKPGCHVYTKCFGTGKSRSVVFDGGEETTQKGVTYLKLDCHYLDHDGHELGEVGIELGIVKFRGRKPIHTLDAFPLQYHPDHKQTTQHLVERGRKFSQFMRDPGAGIPIRHCKGTAFMMKNGKPVALNIDSRVAVDAALFHAMEPNYRRPRVSDCWEDRSTSYTIFGEEHRQEPGKLEDTRNDEDPMTNDEFLICCPTVRCFSFNEKLFCEFYIPPVHELTTPVAMLTRQQWSVL